MFLKTLFLFSIILANHEQETVDALATAIEQWQRDVEFTSRFRLMQGRSDSLDIALSGKSSLTTRMTGVLHKKGEKIRLSVSFGHPPKLIQANELGPNLYTDVSFDHVTNSQIELFFEPETNQQATITLSELTSKVSRSGLSDYVSLYLTPLHPLRARDGNPLRLSHPLKDVQVRTLNDRIEVFLRAQEGIKLWERRVQFWTEPDTPVVTRIEDRLISGETVFEYYVVLLDFQECPGGYVARRVLHVEPNLRTIEGGTTTFVTEWSSEDLGSRAPLDSDFVIEVPPRTRFVGFKGLPTFRPNRPSQRVDIDTLALSDVRSRIDSPQSRRGTMLLWYCAPLLIVLVLIVTWRIRRSVK